MKVYLIKDFNTNEYMSQYDWRYTKNPCAAKIYHSLHYSKVKVKELDSCSWYRNNKDLRVVVFDMNLENEREYIDGTE